MTMYNCHPPPFAALLQTSGVKHVCNSDNLFYNFKKVLWIFGLHCPQALFGPLIEVHHKPQTTSITITRGSCLPFVSQLLIRSRGKRVDRIRFIRGCIWLQQTCQGLGCNECLT